MKWQPKRQYPSIICDFNLQNTVISERVSPLSDITQGNNCERHPLFESLKIYLIFFFEYLYFFLVYSTYKDTICILCNCPFMISITKSIHEIMH